MQSRPIYDQPNSRQSAGQLLLLAAIVAVYVGLSVYQINLPGLHYDEAFEAVPALQLLQGQPVTAFRNSGLVAGDRLLPLMTQDYIGALNTYLALPFIALLGPTPAALRVMSILVGAVTLGLAYSLSYFLTASYRAGLVTALLLAVDPTFIFWNRQGVFVTAITAALGLAATVSWIRRWQTGKRGWAVIGAFFLGLGLYAKFLFLWLIVALVGAVILLNLSRLRNILTDIPRVWRLYKGETLLSSLAFLGGAAPLLAYNLDTGGTWLSITGNAQTSYYGVNNLAVGSNLMERIKQFGTLVSGSHLWYLGDIVSNPLFLVLFGLMVVGVVYMAIRKTSGSTQSKVALFPFVVIGLVILASIGTVSALWITHFSIVMPWPAIALSTGGWFIYHELKPAYRNKTRWVLGVGLGLLLASNFLSVIRYHRALTESGGLSTHSDAIYDLSDWLASQASGQVIAMDWGLAAPVTYLTGGQVTPIEIFGYGWQPNVQLIDRLHTVIHQPDTLYLWRAPDEIIFDRSPEFKTIYRPLQLEENIEAAFYERSGRPILGVTRLVQRGTAQNPPQ
jgi:hypothetical protein